MADGGCLILVLSAPSKVRAPFDAVSTFLVVRCRSGAQLWGSARRWLRSEFHYRSETIALVCLGPFVLLSVPPEANGFVAKLERRPKPTTPKWIYSGYQMTVISNQEEEQAKPMLGDGEMKFYPQTGLERAGTRFSSNTTPWTGHVVVDRELITGQNPASALEVGQRLVERLK